MLPASGGSDLPPLRYLPNWGKKLPTKYVRQKKHQDTVIFYLFPFIIFLFYISIKIYLEKILGRKILGRK